MLRYRDGLFLPVPGMSSLDQAAQQQKAEDVFLALLMRANAMRRLFAANKIRNEPYKTGSRHSSSRIIIAREEGNKCPAGVFRTNQSSSTALISPSFAATQERAAQLGDRDAALSGLDLEDSDVVIKDGFDGRGLDAPAVVVNNDRPRLHGDRDDGGDFGMHALPSSAPRSGTSSAASS